MTKLHTNQNKGTYMCNVLIGPSELLSRIWNPRPVHPIVDSRRCDAEPRCVLVLKAEHHTDPTILGGIVNRILVPARK